MLFFDSAHLHAKMLTFNHDTDTLGIENRKPSTLAFELMHDFYGVPYEKMVYIGDNLKKDMQPPLNLGMKFIHFDNEDGIYRP